MGEIMEEIFIKELQVFGHHGVYENEKTNGQMFLIDCEIETEFSQAVASDNLAETVDYGNVCMFIKEYFSNHTYDLLEKVADELATKLMYAFSGISKITLAIHKPNAPIPMEFQSVGVRISKKWRKVAISFGSNIEPKEEYLTKAMEKLIANPAIRNMEVSEYITTKPYGYTQQDDFLNGAAVFETILSPEQLLDLLHKLENDANRVRQIHWGPRTLDLDILLYDDWCVNTKNLIIPHIDMKNREFVLKPLVSIAPGMIHPVYHMTILDMERKLQVKKTLQE